MVNTDTTRQVITYQVLELQNPALIGTCYTVATPGFQLFDMLQICAF